MKIKSGNHMYKIQTRGNILIFKTSSRRFLKKAIQRNNKHKQDLQVCIILTSFVTHKFHCIKTNSRVPISSLLLSTTALNLHSSIIEFGFLMVEKSSGHEEYYNTILKYCSLTAIEWCI